jgi:hypothetical protein
LKGDKDGCIKTLEDLGFTIETISF